MLPLSRLRPRDCTRLKFRAKKAQPGPPGDLAGTWGVNQLADRLAKLRTEGRRSEQDGGRWSSSSSNLVYFYYFFISSGSNDGHVPRQIYPECREPIGF
jgi:hypothetical protein